MPLSPVLWPPPHSEYDQAEVEDKEWEQVKNQLPSAVFLTEEEVENRERELKRDFKTPLRVSDLVGWIILIMVVVVALGLLDVFHLI